MPAPGSGKSSRAGRVGGEWGERWPPPGGAASLSPPKQPRDKRGSSLPGWARGHPLLGPQPLPSVPQPARSTQGQRAPKHCAGVRPRPCGHCPCLPWRVAKALDRARDPGQQPLVARASGSDPEGPSLWTSRQAGPCPCLQGCAQGPRKGRQGRQRRPADHWGRALASSLHSHRFPGAEWKCTRPASSPGSWGWDMQDELSPGAWVCPGPDRGDAGCGVATLCCKEVLGALQVTLWSCCSGHRSARGSTLDQCCCSPPCSKLLRAPHGGRVVIAVAPNIQTADRSRELECPVTLQSQQAQHLCHPACHHPAGTKKGLCMALASRPAHDRTGDPVPGCAVELRPPGTGR